MSCSVVATAVTSADYGGGGTSHTVVGSAGGATTSATTDAANVTVAGNNRIAINVHYGGSVGGDHAATTDATTPNKTDGPGVARSMTSPQSGCGDSGGLKTTVSMNGTLPSTTPLQKQQQAWEEEDKTGDVYTDGDDGHSERHRQGQQERHIERTARAKMDHFAGGLFCARRRNWSHNEAETKRGTQKIRRYYRAFLRVKSHAHSLTHELCYEAGADSYSPIR